MELVRRTVKINIDTREITQIKEEPAEPMKAKAFHEPVIRTIHISCKQLEDLVDHYLNQEYYETLMKDSDYQLSESP